MVVPLSLVLPLVEDNDCHKIKVAVLLLGATSLPLFILLYFMMPLAVVELKMLYLLLCTLGGDLWEYFGLLGGFTEELKPQNKIKTMKKID